MMPSNCSRCTHNIQENDRPTARIVDAIVRKGNLSVGKDEKVSVPPVSTDSSINPFARSPPPDKFLMASGGKCRMNAQLVSLIQPTETFNWFSIKQQVVVRGRAFSGLYSFLYGFRDDEASHH